MTTKWSKAFLAVVMIFMLLPIHAFADFEAQVLTSTMKVYFAPTTKAESIGSLSQGTKVTVEKFKGNWARINYKGNVGFAQIQDMISLSPDKGVVTATAKVYYITKDNTKPRYTKAKKGTPVYVCGKKGNNYLVKSADGDALGYIGKKYVTIIK